MSKIDLSVIDISFGYDSSPQAVISDCTINFKRGWTGITGANGAGKTTLLKIATGLLEPGKGVVSRAGSAHYCPQRTDTAPDEFEVFLDDYLCDASIIKKMLEIDYDWGAKWEVLSHGERKRAQLGVALWNSPDILALDEPTNHIDISTRNMIIESLQRYPGTGLIVSHDRELLDILCTATVLVSPQAVTMRAGGYSKALAQYELEKCALEQKEIIVKREILKLKNELHKRKQKEVVANRAKSKRKLAAGDSDGRQKIDAARVAGKDAVAGRLSAKLAARIGRLEEKSELTCGKTQYDTGITFFDGAVKRDYLCRMPSGNLSICKGRVLAHPEIVIRPSSRISLSGSNGVGKSTLITEIVANLSVSPDSVLYLPQEICESEAEKIIGEIRAFPSSVLGRLMTIVSRLNSRPDRVLATKVPSPGETRKLLLAMGLLRFPSIIIMDEPTNHLDIVSIECLENALMDWRSALVLVSHDKRFLKALTQTAWRIERSGDTGNAELILEEAYDER